MRLALRDIPKAARPRGAFTDVEGETGDFTFSCCRMVTVLLFHGRAHAVKITKGEQKRSEIFAANDAEIFSGLGKRTAVQQAPAGSEERKHADPFFARSDSIFWGRPEPGRFLITDVTDGHRYFWSSGSVSPCKLWSNAWGVPPRVTAALTNSSGCSPRYRATVIL
jgi:hypothetical protein